MDAPRRDPVPPREAALSVAGRLREAGHLALFAGGCVRDRLRGEDPVDYDVATDATPARVKELFPRARGVGEAFGVVLVRRGGRTVEVATFRSDGAYSDGRHPDAIRYGTPREDAARRDFTINGLFEDPFAGEVIDYVGGRADLASGIVRAIGDPTARLAEDRLRALRAVRFAARFGYAVEPSTRDAVAASASDLRGVSRERIGQELRRMLDHPARATAVAELEALGLDVAVLEEPARGALQPLARVAGLPPQGAFEAALAAWLLDRLAGREGAATARVRAWRGALVLSNDETARLASIVELVEVLEGRAASPWQALPDAARKRLAARREFGEALAVMAARYPDRAEEVRAEVAELARTGLAPIPLVGGDDLVRDLRLRPGPSFRAILDAVYDAQLEGRVQDRVGALRLAAELAARRESPGDATRPRDRPGAPPPGDPRGSGGTPSPHGRPTS